MGASTHEMQRVFIQEAAKGLVTRARAHRAQMAQDAPDRQFYLGVEAAAEEVLHPELAGAKPDGWLEREAALFRSGYLQTSNMVATARTSPNPPHTLPLPELERPA